MEVIILGGSAIVPSLLLLWYIRARDKNPEPRALLLKTFLLGALICVPVVPLAMGLQELGRGLAVGVWGSALVKAFLGAAIPEELFKFLVLRGYVWRKHHFDEPLDGVVYGATASLGFATLENILYVGEHGFGVAVLRALTAVPGHEVLVPQLRDPLAEAAPHCLSTLAQQRLEGPASQTLEYDTPEVLNSQLKTEKCLGILC